MRPFNRLFSAFIVVCCLLITTNSAYASHSAGADLTYSCLSNNTYQIDLNFYYDCAGSVSAPSNPIVSITSASCGQSLNLTLNNISSIEVSQLCPSQLGSSSCNGGSLPGIEQYVYSNTITLPQGCTDWEISYALCCRNNAVTNISGASGEDIYIESTINNAGGLCNNSPFFTTLPVPYLCVGNEFFYNHGAVDIDGDSLVYTLVTPLGNSGDPVSYNSPFTATNPMATTSGFTFDNQTGQMSATPSQTQNAVVTVRVDEYRNGQLIGTTMRDMQFIVINCPSNDPPVASGVNGTNDFFIEMCAGGANCFTINTSDPNAGQTVSITWNNGIPGGTFGSTGNPPVATFCWTPTTADIRANPYTFTVSLQDNACPTVGSSVRSYNVFVRGLNVDLGPDTTICGSSYTINPLLSGGSGIYSYNWSTGSNDPTLTVTTTGNYSLTVTDTAGCSGTGDVLVTLSNSGSQNLIPYNDTTVCPGTPVTFDAGTGFASYEWSTGAQTQTITTSTSGIYGVTATNSAGCQFTDSVELIVNNNLTVNIGNNGTTCSNTPYTFNAGPGYASYEWSTGAQTQTITTATAGVYSVTVYDQLGCSASDTATLAVNPAPYVDLGNNRTVCDAPYRLSIRRPSGFTYLWNNGSTLYYYDVLVSGLYSVTLTDNFGCSNSDSVYITVSPTTTTDLIAYPDTLICAGESVTLDAGAGYIIYEWSTQALTRTITVSTAGTYLVTVTDSFGCSNIDSVVVNVSPLPVVDLGVDFGVCDSNTRSVLDAGAGFSSYLWSTQATTQTITVTGPGTYSVTVTNAAGCEDDDEVTLFLFPTVTVNLGADDTICLGQSKVLNAGTFRAYEWSDGSTNSTLSVSVAGLYSVTVTDNNGCTATDEVEVTTELCCFPASFGNLFTLIDNSNNLVTADQVGSGKYYVTVDIIVSNGATLDLTNVDMVFLSNAGIVFTDSSKVRANNSVFRSCDEGQTWKGFDFLDASSGLINESTFKNAETAVDVQSSESVNLTNNEIYNAAVGLFLDGAGAATYDANVTGNTFVTNSDIPEYLDQSGAARTDFFGIRVFNTNATGLFAQNDFVNAEVDQFSNRYFGVYINNSSLVASANNFTNMERAFDVTGASSLVTIEGNTIDYTFRMYPDVIAIRITNVNMVLVEGNTLSYSVLGATPTSSFSQVGLYISDAQNVIAANNEISGFYRGVSVSGSRTVDVFNNKISDLGDVGVLVEKGTGYLVRNNEVSGSGTVGIYALNVLSDLTIYGNDVDNIDASLNTTGITFAITDSGTVASSSILIGDNCVRNTRNAVRLTTNVPNTVPVISNNYFYNYTNHGIWSTDYTGSIGDCVGYPTNVGRNSFVSNYLSPFGTALDIRSDNTTIYAQGNSANLVTNFPNVLVNTSCNTTSNSTCGNQIGNNELGGMRNSALLHLSLFKQNIEKSFPLASTGTDFNATANYLDMIAAVDFDTRATYAVNMLRILADNSTIAEAQAFYTALNNSNVLSVNDKNWVAFEFNKMLGNYTMAMAKLNAYVATTTNAEDLVAIERIYTQLLIDGRPVQELTATEISTLQSIDNANRFNSPVARDMVQASIGGHDYKFGGEDLASDSDTDGATAISLDESILDVYPNPVGNQLTIRYNTTTNVEETTIAISDVLGRIIYQSNITFENGEITVDVSNFPSGAYIVAIMSNKEVVAHSKLIKK